MTCCSCQAGGQKYCSCLIGNKASSLTETLKAWHAAFIQLGFGNYSAATQTRTAYVRWGRAIPASLTGCHWYTNSLSISSGFSSRLSNHYRSQNQSRPYFSSFTGTDFCFTHNQNILLIWHAEEAFSRSRGQMCMCFALSRSFESSVWA